jgi:multicomponent Na+:H+ antiporter subunit B
VKPGTRLWLFAGGMAGLATFYLWGLEGLPGFGHYPGPYGNVVSKVAVRQAHATGLVSAVNFGYRGFDTLGEEFILFVAATGVATVLRRLRGEREEASAEEAKAELAETSEAVRMVAVLLVGPMVLFGWFLSSHAQTSPSGGFQGGVVLASAFVLVYLGGHFSTFRRLSPLAVVESAEALGAGSFAAIGVSALAFGLAYLSNILPLGHTPGAVDSSGTIALISFFVGIEVTAAFVLMVAEFLEQVFVIEEAGS